VGTGSREESASKTGIQSIFGSDSIRTENALEGIHGIQR